MKSRLACLLLLFSGAAALILEVAWFRRTAQLAGATSVAMGAVLAAVIGGMALGSWWLGRIADRAARPLRLYGWLEAGIAAGALLTPTLLDAARPLFDAIQRGLGDAPALATPARFLLATLLLAPPSILMGGSLPAIACALEERGSGRGRELGRLYASNTFGAVAGTVLAGFVLVPALGLAGAMRSAAALSGIAAAVALAWRGPAGRPAPKTGRAAPAARRAILLYAASGLLGLVAEVAFARHLVLVFGSTTYAFTTMLAVFLLGIGIGGGTGARLARRETGHLRLLENTLALTAALFSAATLVVYLLPRLYLEGVLGWAGGFEAGLALRFALAALVLLPGAIGLGIAFPLAAHVASERAMGAGVGRLYAANTLASIAGSTLAVFVLVPWLGPQYAVAATALLAALLVAATGRRRLLLVLLAASGAGLIPPAAAARERLHAGVYFYPDAFTTGDRIDERTWAQGVDIRFVRYGREATVAIWSWYGTDGVLIDGKAVATNQVVADDHHLALLGHLPMALHRDPQRVLVVGLGMGTTYRAVRMHAPRVLRVVELEEAVVEAAARLRVRPHDLVLADARSFLRATDETFDVITSDPIHPWVRGGGDLYTVEYFRSVGARLAPGGVACQWLPVFQMGVRDIRAVLRTFAAVFPDAAAWYGGGDLVLVGSARGTLPEPRHPRGEAQAALAAIGANDLASLRVFDREGMLRAAGPGPLLTDDALRLEFSTPRQVDNHELADCLEWLLARWKDAPPVYAHMLSARAARARGDWELMFLQLSEARRSDPDNRYVRRYRGEFYLMQAESEIRAGELDAALVALAKSRLWIPDDPRLIGVEADLRLLQGRPAQALPLLEKLLERTPDSAYLRRRIEALR